MKADMGGAAATFGAAKALGQIKPLGVEVCLLAYLYLDYKHQHRMILLNSFKKNSRYISFLLPVKI